MNESYRRAIISFNRYVVVVMGLLGGTLLVISAVLSAARRQAYPDSWLLYDVRYSESFEMYRMNPDDQSTQTLSAGTFFFYPVGSPNGAWFAFWGWGNKRWHLYQMRINGGKPRVVLANQRNLFRHQWSEDGHKVQLTAPRARTPHNDPWQGPTPTLSPDGQWLAFLSQRTPGGLYRMRLDRSEFQLIAADPYILDSTIVWSPDSQWISYVSQHNRETAIYRARVDGSQVERLTQENLPYRRLSWMPSADLPLNTPWLLIVGLGMIGSSLIFFRKQSR